MLSQDAYSQWLGIEILECEVGRCKVAMTIRKEMLNSMNKAHGGITFSLADTAFGFAANTHGKFAVSIETSINHIEAVNEGDYLIAESIIEKVNNKLEGTVHVNMALIIKFMANYFFNPKAYPDVPRRDDGSNDDFLFNQGPTKGLGSIQFHDYHEAYNSYDLPNLTIFKEQIALFKEMAMKAPPSKEQAKDIDFLLTAGEMFTLVVYGQLILENAKIYNMDAALIDQIFDFMVRDFSKFALQLYSKPSSSEAQMAQCLKMIKKPVVDATRYETVWSQHVVAMKGQYAMPR